MSDWRKARKKARVLDCGSRLFQWEHAETVVIIGGGESVTQADVDHVRGKAYVIVINDAYKLAPWADMLYACDFKWWYWHQPDFAGRKVTQEKEAANLYGLEWIESRKGEGLSISKEFIHQGGNSGFQTLNIAHLMGAKEIYLLGYDMQGVHWFGDHPDKLRPEYQPMIDAFNQVQIGGVVNCSMESALTCFPKKSITDCL